ncbi:hypothetical protein GCM10020220_077490 [Nonomuraea rubra]
MSARHDAPGTHGKPSHKKRKPPTPTTPMALVPKQVDNVVPLRIRDAARTINATRLVVSLLRRPNSDDVLDPPGVTPILPLRSAWSPETAPTNRVLPAPKPPPASKI